MKNKPSVDYFINIDNQAKDCLKLMEQAYSKGHRLDLKHLFEKLLILTKRRHGQ